MWEIVGKLEEKMYTCNRYSNIMDVLTKIFSYYFISLKQFFNWKFITFCNFVWIPFSLNFFTALKLQLHGKLSIKYFYNGACNAVLYQWPSTFEWLWIDIYIVHVFIFSLIVWFSQLLKVQYIFIFIQPQEKSWTC